MAISGAPARTPQVQDAFLTKGVTRTPGIELTALDAIGYDLVPEPGSLALIVTCVVVGSCGFRRGSQNHRK